MYNKTDSVIDDRILSEYTAILILCKNTVEVKIGKTGKSGVGL